MNVLMKYVNKVIKINIKYKMMMKIKKLCKCICVLSAFDVGLRKKPSSVMITSSSLSAVIFIAKKAKPQIELKIISKRKLYPKIFFFKKDYL